MLITNTTTAEAVAKYYIAVKLDMFGTEQKTLPKNLSEALYFIALRYEKRTNTRLLHTEWNTNLFYMGEFVFTSSLLLKEFEQHPGTATRWRTERSLNPIPGFDEEHWNILNEIVYTAAKSDETAIMVAINPFIIDYGPYKKAFDERKESFEY